MQYVSLSLVGFEKLWNVNVSFGTTLLTQFVEDMEDYLEVNLYFNIFIVWKI